jgi:hypothetical protein
MTRTDILFIFAGIAVLSIFSFLVGLLSWFVILRGWSLDTLRPIRTALLWFTVASVVFAAMMGISNYLVASDQLRQNGEKMAFLILAPVFVAAFLLASAMALHLRVRSLERATQPRS